MSKSLYQKKKKWEEASVIQKLNSKLQRKRNIDNLNLTKRLIHSKVANEHERNMSKFSGLFKELFPKEYEEIVKEYEKRYGKPPKKKELRKKFIDEINNPFLKKKFAKREK